MENLTVKDIDDIENHAKIHLKDKLTRWLKEDNEYEHMDPAEFAFLPGHRKIIALIPKKISATTVPLLALKSATRGNELSTSVISSNFIGQEVSISIDEQAALESELCRNVRNWMVTKGFHESVSI